MQENRKENIKIIEDYKIIYSMSKIGILTLPFGPNYGMNLQVYALQTVLKNLGHEVIVINRKWNRVKTNSGLIVSIKRFVYYKIVCRKIFSFYKRNIHLSKPCFTSEDIAKLCNEEKIDYVIVGSDQVWRIENTRGANLDFFGGFMNEISYKTRIISYAASFGTGEWKGTEIETNEVSKLLKSFTAVSVREEAGAELCKKLFGIKAVITLDPTLLLKSQDYKANEYIEPENKKMIVSYILDNSASKLSLIQRIGKVLGIDNYKELYPQNRSNYTIYKYKVEEWLNYIRNASFVVTDSFHGMVFSLLFNKQFVVIGNKKRGLERFTSILGSLGISDRLVLTIDDFDIDIIHKDIDYLRVNNLIEALRQKSLSYLKSNIGA